MGAGQPGLRPTRRTDGLELAGISGDQCSHSSDLSTGGQQCLLRTGLESPAQGEDARCGNDHSRYHEAGHGREGGADHRRQDACDKDRQNWDGHPDPSVDAVAEVGDAPGEKVGAASAAQPCRCLSQAS